MNKKLKAIFIIEIFIVLGLIFHVISTPRMWVVLALAILFTILATRSRAHVLRIISFHFLGNIGNDSLHSWMVLVSNYLPYDCLHRFLEK
ncbi:type VII secretion protein EccE, eccE [Lactococcus lactis subsp. lactis]|nr:type VII secretion protein EccE, eccE [Lactococcus lactis subsp. lactis]